MEITKNSIIGDLVAQDYRTASVFKKNNIDFCCNGNRSIQEACTTKNIDVDQLIHDLGNSTQQAANGAVDYKTWPLDLLADYIEKKHHRYVREKIQEITPYLRKIAQVHGGHHPELLEIEKLFSESAEELTNHMMKEERILFPHIREMVKAHLAGNKVNAPFGTVQNPINMMMHEHNVEGERFRQIAALSNNYTTPADGCNTYRVSLAMLKEFEDDLHLHIHLENNILFPGALLMEQA